MTILKLIWLYDMTILILLSLYDITLLVLIWLYNMTLLTWLYLLIFFTFLIPRLTMEKHTLTCNLKNRQTGRQKGHQMADHQKARHKEGRQANRQTVGQTSHQTDGLAGRQTDRQVDGQKSSADELAGRQKDRQTGTPHPRRRGQGPQESLWDFGSVVRSSVPWNQQSVNHLSSVQLSIICHQDTCQSSVINTPINHLSSRLLSIICHLILEETKIWSCQLSLVEKGESR